MRRRDFFTNVAGLGVYVTRDKFRNYLLPSRRSGFVLDVFSVLARPVS